MIINGEWQEFTGGYKDYGTPEYAARNKETIDRQNREAKEKADKIMNRIYPNREEKERQFSGCRPADILDNYIEKSMISILHKYFDLNVSLYSPLKFYNY